MRQCFAHVIDGQCRDTGSGECFHLNTGPMVNLATTVNNRIVVIHTNRNLAIVQAKRMTERNQFVSSFRRHYTRNDCRGKNRSLCRLNIAIGKSFSHRFREPNCRPRVRFTAGGRFLADVHHGGLIVFVYVAEFGHLIIRQYDTFQLCLEHVIRQPWGALVHCNDLPAAARFCSICLLVLPRSHRF